MSGTHSTDRPLAFWLDAEPTDGPDPWSARDTADTDPAPPPVSGRYAWTAPERAALPARSAVRPRAERQTDPCVTPPPGSDRGGARVTVLPAPPWRGGATGGEE